MDIDYTCYLNFTGYSQAAQDMIMALHRHSEHNIRITCTHGSPNISAISVGRRAIFDEMLKKSENKNALRIFHCIPDQQKRFARLRMNIGFATFETFDPPAHWKAILDKCDGVICPSHFNFKTFAHSRIKPSLFHIPHTIDIENWNDQVKPLKENSGFSFLFLGAWRKRKGWQALIEAWVNEFGAQENVSLTIKTDRIDQSKKDCDAIISNLAKDKKDIAPILFEDSIFTEEQMPSFIRSFDCLIAPTMGEGFGLPGLQCMSLKVPVITTDFSGCQDYALEDNCTLLKPSGFLIHDCLDAIPQFRGKKWPRITVRDIQEAMRRVYSRPDDIKLKTQNAYNYVQNNFSYDKVVKKFDSMMETLYSG